MIKEKAVIFGISEYFNIKKRSIFDSYNILALCDNDEKKWGTTIDKFDVISPQKLGNYIINDIRFIITSEYFVEIINQLLEMGVNKENIILGSIFEPHFYGEIPFMQHGKNIKLDIIYDGYILLNYEDIRLKLKTDNAFYIVNEVFNNKIYNFNIKDECIVIDIGMNIAISTLFMALKPNVNKVYSFEPFKPTYELGIFNINLNKKLKNKIHAYNYGLGESDKKIELFYDENNMGGMSTIHSNFRNDHKVTRENIRIKNAANCIKHIIDLNKNKKIVLKIDCEGSEHEILNNLNNRNLLFEVNLIMMEWHNVDDKIIIENILTNNNFEYICTGEKSGMFYAFK